MKSTFDISNFIETLGDDLFRIFERSSRDGIHPDEVGRAKEINIKKQLELAFNSGMGIGRGFVVDSFGNISKQCDIILYEKDYIPVFVYDENEDYGYYPCEGVIAVGEIKSTLNQKEFEDSMEKLEKVKELKRFSKDNCSVRHYFTKFELGCSAPTFDPVNKMCDSIFTFIFCKENRIALDTIIKTLNSKYLSKTELAPDRVYSFNKNPIGKLFFDGSNYVLYGEHKANLFCALEINVSPFGFLVSDIANFHGRTKEFLLGNYYKIGINVKI